MDHDAFDTFTRTLSETGSRRGILGLLATLPVLGGLFALLDSDETDAKGRRKRRKKRHKHGKGRDAGKGKGKKPRKCKPHTLSKTCQGKCGPVKNTCKKTVDCGSCDCDPSCGACETCTDALVCEPCDPCCDDVCCDQPNAICHADSGACCVPDSKAQTCNNQCSDVINNCGVSVDCGPCTCPGGCPECQVCDAEIGECIPDSSQEGDDCGQDGQVCQSDGTCSCDASSCPSCTTCENDGFCAPCADCCDGNGVCQDGGTDTACGSSGTCDVCTGQEECQGQQCVCVPACTGEECGPDGCGDQCGPGCAACETCLGDGTCSAPCGSTGCCASGACEMGTSDSACGRNGEPCQVCSGMGATCGGGGTPGVCGCTPTTCLAEGKNCGTIDDECGSMLNCGSCDANGTTPICIGNICVACSASNPCPGGCCQADGSCGGACRIFTSSTTSTGDLDGLAGADATCQGLAEAAGLPGTYLAWLSDPSGSPSTRFPLAGSPTAGPYVLIGTPAATIASDWNSLTTRVSCFDGSGGPCIDQPINRDETGAAVTSPFVAWTGTGANGAQFSSGNICNNWTDGTSAVLGWIGQTDEVNNWWSITFGIQCNNAYHLYCFQQG